MKPFLNSLILFTLVIAVSCSTSRHISQTERDGSSFSKAVIVKSIQDEYRFAAEACGNCKFLGQSLVFKKGKPYDILKYQKPNGDIVLYYFDISEFYGKGF